MKKVSLISLFAVISILIMSMSTVFANDNDTPILIMGNPYAENSIKVLLNDQTIDFTDENGNIVEPQIINSRTMVPMRKIFEVFGAEISWNGETKEVTATTADKTLKLQIDNVKASISTAENIEEITLDSAPVIIEGRTMVPVRFIAESLNLKVGWDDATKTVVILDKSFIFEKLQKEAPTFYELITTDIKNTSELQEATLSGTGTVKYTNSKDKSSNTNINVKLEGKIKTNEDAVSLNLKVKTTGKGSLIDSIRQSGFENITFDVIVDKQTLIEYIKSSLLESEVGDKWVAIELSQYANDLVLTNESAEASSKELLDKAIDSIELTPYTYQALNQHLDLFCKLFSDKYLSVKGKSSKTYTYEISLSDISEILGLDETTISNSDNENKIEAKLNITLKIEDNVATNSSISIKGNTSSANEKISFDISGECKVSNSDKNIKITIPSESEVVRIDEM